jgi:hypothetical protein
MEHNVSTPDNNPNTHIYPWGFILTILSWTMYLFEEIYLSVFTHPISENTLSWLKGISLVLAIICSIFTIAHYTEIYIKKWFKK